MSTEVMCYLGATCRAGLKRLLTGLGHSATLRVAGVRLIATVFVLLIGGLSGAQARSGPAHLDVEFYGKRYAACGRLPYAHQTACYREVAKELEAIRLSLPPSQQRDAFFLLTEALLRGKELEEAVALLQRAEQAVVSQRRRLSRTDERDLAAIRYHLAAVLAARGQVRVAIGRNAQSLWWTWRQRAGLCFLLLLGWAAVVRVNSPRGTAAGSVRGSRRVLWLLVIIPLVLRVSHDWLGAAACWVTAGYPFADRISGQAHRGSEPLAYLLWALILFAASRIVRRAQDSLRRAPDPGGVTEARSSGEAPSPSLFVLTALGVVGLATIMASDPDTRHILAGDGRLQAWPTIWQVVLAGVIGGAAMEVLFRGCLLPVMVSHYGPVVSVSAVSFAYAAARGSIDALPSLFIAGCVYGLAYLVTGRVRMSLMLHVLFNIVVLAFADNVQRVWW